MILVLEISLIMSHYILALQKKNKLDNITKYIISFECHFSNQVLSKGVESLTLWEKLELKVDQFFS